MDVQKCHTAHRAYLIRARYAAGVVRGLSAVDEDLKGERGEGIFHILRRCLWSFGMIKVMLLFFHPSYVSAADGGNCNVMQYDTPKCLPMMLPADTNIRIDFHHQIHSDQGLFGEPLHPEPYTEGTYHRTARCDLANGEHRNTGQ